MAKQNFYAGVTLAYDTVEKYYPPSNNPDFDHFVFQQMINDGTQANDLYTLIGYAMDGDGNVLDQVTLDAPPKNDKQFQAGKQVQFANMRLDINDLDILYQSGGTPDINIYPKDFYNETGYVYYCATTVDGGKLGAGSTVTINPSPPA